MRAKVSLVFILVQIVLAFANYGGHDVFTSLAQLKELWKNDLRAVKDMRDILQKLDQIKEPFERYIQSHESIQLNQEPNFEYLGHPLNSYHFVRHVALGWDEVRTKTLAKMNETAEALGRLLHREDYQLPSIDDVHGAAFGIARLHSLYSLDTKELMENGVIKTNLKKGMKAKSAPSIRSFDSWDVNVLSFEARSHGLHNTAVDVSPYILDKLEAEESALDRVVLNLFGQERPKKNETEKAIRMGIELHDQLLIRRGSRSGGHRTHSRPVDAKLRKKKKYKRPFELGTPFTNATEVRESRRVENPEATLKSQFQMEMLCTGDTFRDPKQDADLYCTYAHNNSPWLKLAPLKIELKSKEPYIVVLRELMFAHECDNITQFLGPKLDFPPGRMGGGKVHKNDWTMKNTWPIEDDNIYLEKMTRRVEHIGNLFASSSKGQSDRFMCGNYGIGGHYGTHPDYYDYSEAKLADPMDNGNRIVTVMTVLEAPQAGGATVWPYVGVSVFPEKGSAVMWFNTKSDAVPDELTLHAACPVLLGQKWIGNKWIGYKPQMFRRSCGLKPEERLMGPFA